MDTVKHRDALLGGLEVAKRMQYTQLALSVDEATAKKQDLVHRWLGHNDDKSLRTRCNRIGHKTRIAKRGSDENWCCGSEQLGRCVSLASLGDQIHGIYSDLIMKTLRLKSDHGIL